MNEKIKQKNKTRNWIKITVRCPDLLTDPVSDMMCRLLSGTGVEITSLEKETDVSGYLQVNGPLEKNTHISPTSFELLQKTEKELQNIFSLFNHSFPGVCLEIIDEKDWGNSWKEHFNTFEIVPGLVIKPSWQDYVPTQGQKVLELDPGMAFGTGQHSSTQLALSLMRNIFSVKGRKIKKVLDVGTGTGILGMSAALWGAIHVVATDNDPEAVEVALANIKANRLEKTVQVGQMDLDEVQGPFDCICANIFHDVLVEMAPMLRTLLSTGGSLILSGILHGDQEGNIQNTMESLGLKLLKRECKDEWAGLMFEK